tara:strand:- start:100 stop:456 length:357 start_codon:yes stop_codon:yes gene_type:complete
MKWKDLEGAALCFRETPEEPPAPIVLSGVRNDVPWLWTGDDGHLRHYKGGELVMNGDQAKVVGSGEILAWIAKIDDTPEIRDPEEFKMLAAALETESKTVHFKTWLKDKLDAIAGEEV